MTNNYMVVINLSLTLSNNFQHEDLSVSIFRHLMTENVNVLAEFINLKENLGIHEFQLIELMIRPPEREQKLPDMWKCREFLCEVSVQYISAGLYII